MHCVTEERELHRGDNITVFEELVKKLGGSLNYKVASEFQGKQTHRTVAIGLKYFEQAIQKRIIKMVQKHFWQNSLCSLSKISKI